MQKRNILWWMFLLLLMVNTFVTLNINIAIVSMVNNDDSANSSNLTGVVCPNTSFYWNDNREHKSSKSNQLDSYDWNEQEKNMALSSYYWLSSISGFAGGYLSQKYGSKIILGYSQLTASILSSFIPLLAPYGPSVVAFTRMMQGVFAFIAVPGSILSILSNWSPPHERGKFFAVFLIGSTLGLGIGSFTFGLIAEYVHWKYIYHFTSLSGLVWFILWHFLIYETPEDHPTVTRKEKEYIARTLRSSMIEEKVSIPWKAILTSVPVIVAILGFTGFMWHFFMLTTFMPSYLQSIYGMNSNQIGIVTSLPAVLSGLSAYGTGLIGDMVVKRGWLSMTVTRKLFTIVACAGASITLIIMAYTECNVYLILVTYTISIVTRNFSAFGVDLAILDLSPKFCGIVNGVTTAFTSLANVALLVLITYLSDALAVDKLWQIVFLFTAKLNIIFSLLYVVYGTSKVQSWNFVAPSQLKENHDTAPLRKAEQPS